MKGPSSRARLSLLSDADRDDFLSAFCGNADDCNVTVTASDRDGDGRNDSWTTDADNDTALICDLTNDVVIGVAEGVSFTMEAEAQ